jgi:transcriptional regulator with XRE-family HTH domain
MRSPDYTVDGPKVKAAREMAGFTQEQLARLVGVTRGAIGQWESANISMQPNAANFKALAKALRVSRDSLLVAPHDQAA